MSSKTILFLLFCHLVSRRVDASEYKKIDFNIHLSSQTALLTDEAIINFLQTKGVYINDSSSIYIHEEKNAINLTCFDCVIRDIGAEVSMVQSSNEWGGGR